MDERDTMVWAAAYAAALPMRGPDHYEDHAARKADEAVDEYRKRRGGPAHLFYAERDFASEIELIDYLKTELYHSRPAWRPAHYFKSIDNMGMNPSCAETCPSCGSPPGYYCNDENDEPIDGPHQSRKNYARARAKVKK